MRKLAAILILILFTGCAFKEPVYPKYKFRIMVSNLLGVVRFDCDIYSTKGNDWFLYNSKTNLIGEIHPGVGYSVIVLRNYY